MATPRFTATEVGGTLEAAFLAMSQPIAGAATSAVHTAGDNLKRDGRASIKSAGFSARSANAWRVEFFPKRGESIDSAAFAYWKLPYSAIFETGGTITGRPMLWLPMANLPLRVGRGKPTPRNVAAKGVKLFGLTIHGKPFLAANIRVSKSELHKPVTSVSFADLRSGNRKIGRRAKATDALKAVPLFVGLRSVTLKKRTNLTEIANRERGSLGAYYESALKV